MSRFENVNIAVQDSASIDAFGRWRTSEPQTLFDSKNIFGTTGTSLFRENQPIFFDNQTTAGSGTYTYWNYLTVSQELHTLANVTATQVRQSKMRFNYQPGKSQLVFATFNMNGATANIRKRVGLFDEKNGLFLELANTTGSFVQRAHSSGTPVDTAIYQADWNIDKMDGTGSSGIILDWTKTQILVMDYEWLGVGRARMGFVIDGLIYYTHQFLNANNLDVVYMNTPNLPIRGEIQNFGSGEATSIDLICSTVISEGGSQDFGMIRYSSTSGTHNTLATENQLYALMGIRLKSEYIGTTVDILSAAIQIQSATDKIEWVLVFNPTVANAFNYVDITNSAVQIAIGGSTNTVSGGYQFDGGFLESGGIQGGAAGSVDQGIRTTLKLGSDIDGTRDTIVLCARPIAGSTNVTVESAITWRELI